MGVIYIVIFAAVALLLFGIYDKRTAILTFFKEKVFKPKKIKILEVEKPKIDSDIAPKADKMGYGNIPSPKEAEKKSDKKDEKSESADPNAPKTVDVNDTYAVDNVFEPKEDFGDKVDDEEIDLDKMYEELRSSETEKLGHEFKSEDLDKNNAPDVSNLSMADIDDMLEENANNGKISASDLENYFSNQNGELSGEELGKALKNLPAPLKVLIMSDVLKRKF